MHKSPLERCHWWQKVVLVYLISLLTLALEGTPAAFAKKSIARLRVRQTASQSLTLIKPTNPDFESMLDTYFPGISLEAGYQQAIRPFLVIVRNDTALPAVAYAITWTAHYKGGWVEPLRVMFVNRPLMFRPAMTYVPPGGIRLISPLFNMTPRKYQGHSGFAKIYPADRFPSSNKLDQVDVDMDGVVYTKGTFIGPDKTHVLQRYVMARFAERDEAIAALNLIQSSTALPLMVAQQLQQKLNQEIQWRILAHQSTLLSRYVRARGQSAEDMQRILQDRGLNGLKSVLQNFVNRSGGSSNPSVFGKVYPKLSDDDPRVFGTVPYKPENH